jgi:hypothetical protein
VSSCNKSGGVWPFVLTLRLCNSVPAAEQDAGAIGNAIRYADVGLVSLPGRDSSFHQSASRQPNRCTAGGVHVPSSTAGFGQ